ncbi:hypothetical protein AVEN_150623-1 [Araneus ventricosus]|uniref:Uncharacterized protein n=1 Tax=Araneus ventricosus TaxID=182803 RepID=A0A4Y2MG86_ARAVE|nr:hypothetical protein AVEN_150623-1 [Araneus ventricosus]
MLGMNCVVNLTNFHYKVSIWIKTSKYFTEGPKLVNQSLQSSKYLPVELRNTVDPVIERNGFFAHPEHLMLAMTQDNAKHIKELGFRRILKMRQLDQKKTTIRTFMPPKLNFKAQDYLEIINWMDCNLSSHLLLKDISDDEIKSHIQSDSVPNWDITFKTFPVHTHNITPLHAPATITIWLFKQ